MSYHEFNEEQGASRILAYLQQDKNVALCSNAGMPGISDPGYRAIAAAIENGFALEVIPGPSAGPMALTLSGLPVSSFTFKGFPPKKEGQLEKFFLAEKELPHTLICYESPHRIGKLLTVALRVLGDRRACVCRELTKKFETADRGWLSELATKYAKATVKGEITVVIAGNNSKFFRESNS